jgi:predicted signal transduction protein with EAL and GGDEF domain
MALAHGLRITVVAEGIETEAQFELLRAMGCDVGQGYLFARPLPGGDAGRLLSPSRSSASTRSLPIPGRSSAVKAARKPARPRAARSRAAVVGGVTRRRG